MKLFSFVAITSGARLKEKSQKSFGRVPIQSCTDQIESENFSTFIRNVDLDGRGRLSVIDTANTMNCYIDFGSSCLGDLEINISYINLESWSEKEYNYETYEYDYMYGGCHDTIHFAYTAEGRQQTTEQG